MDPPKPKEPQEPPSPFPLHSTDSDEEDESVKQLKECSVLYLSLQECLIQSNRDWKACQKEVQALKACNERMKNDKGK